MWNSSILQGQNYQRNILLIVLEEIFNLFENRVNAVSGALTICVILIYIVATLFLPSRLA